MFEIYATIDIAAESNKIKGNELRDILYSEAKSYHKFGEHTVNLKEFSITNLEGKLDLSWCTWSFWDELNYFIIKSHAFVLSLISSFVYFILDFSFNRLFC